MAKIKFTLKPGECRVVAGQRFCNRWKRNTASSTQDYINGIKRPKRPWGKTTCEACNHYKEGVDAGHRQDRFRKGVKKKGRLGYLRATITKGPTRFAQGVYAGGSSYGGALVPYWKAIKGMTLPARYFRGDPRNLARCSAVCTVLGRTKTGKDGPDKVTCPEK